MLIQLAAIFREQVRQHDYVARIGGEKLALISPETWQEQAYQLAERLRQYLEQKDLPDIKGLSSIGVTEFHAPEGQDALVRRADIDLQNPVDSP